MASGSQGDGIGGRKRANALVMLMQGLARVGAIVADYRFLLIAVAVIGLAAVAAIFKGNVLVFEDEREYLQLGRTLLNHGVFGYGPDNPTAFRPPAYAAFVGLVSTFFDEALVVRLVQVLVWGICGYLVFVITKDMAGSIAGGLALLMSLGYPLQAYLAISIYPQMLSAVAILIIAKVLFDTQDRRLSFSRLVVLSLASGYLAMSVPILLFVAVVIGGALYFWKRVGFLKAMTPLIVAIVLIGTWVVRNEAYLGIGPAFSTSSGFVLLSGNSENTTASSANLTDISRYEGPVSHLPIHEQNEIMTRHAVEWITENPARFVTLYAAKFVNHFNHTSPMRTNVGDRSVQDVVLFVTYYSLLAVVIIRLFFARSYELRPEETVMFVLYVGAGLAYALFYTKVRYRVPFDPLLMIIAASFLGRVIERLKRGGDEDASGTQSLDGERNLR